MEAVSAVVKAADMRGKVFALMGMVTQGLTPIAFALEGVIAVFIPFPLLISACFGTVVFVGLPFMCMASFRRFINFDPVQSVAGKLEVVHITRFGR